MLLFYGARDCADFFDPVRRRVTMFRRLSAMLFSPQPRLAFVAPFSATGADTLFGPPIALKSTLGFFI